MPTKPTDHRATRPGDPTQRDADSHSKRRHKYANDQQGREKENAAGRDRYRQKNPGVANRLPPALVGTGTYREVKVEGSSRARMLETFSLIEAATTIGKSHANFRRWVHGDLVPKPVLCDTLRGHYMYCREELQIIFDILTEHEKEYAYLSPKHERTVNEIHQRIMGYRDITFGRGNYGRST